MSILEDTRVLITGATGSLGKAILRRLLTGEMGRVRRLILFSRDEAKQHDLRLELLRRRAATDEVIYRDFERRLEFRIGDVRDLHSVSAAAREADVIFHAAALKQVPTCERFPYEAVRTNIEGAENLVRAIREHRIPVRTVVGISTDKACKPVNVMGMSKAIQERLLLRASLDCPDTRFLCVRYGNVLASRGSVIPLFLEQIRAGGPVTLTTPEMTRFLLSLDEAVDTVFAAVREGKSGETFVPRLPSARISDVAEVLIDGRPIRTECTGIRPGEKVHEILISEEERSRTIARAAHYVIRSILPELSGGVGDEGEPALQREYCSADHVLTRDQVRELLRTHGLLEAAASSPSRRAGM